MQKKTEVRYFVIHEKPTKIPKKIEQACCFLVPSFREIAFTPFFPFSEKQTIECKSNSCCVHTARFIDPILLCNGHESIRTDIFSFQRIFSNQLSILILLFLLFLVSLVILSVDLSLDFLVQ